MLRKKIFITFAVGLLLLASSVIVMASGAVDQHGVLAGQVTRIVAVGTTVREGDALVQVNTLTGSMTASRATVDGVVVAVYVKTGDMIKINDNVARIKTGK